MASRYDPLPNQKCLDSLCQNDWSTIESSTKSAGDLMNRVQDFIDFSQEKQLPGRNLMINKGEKKNASDDIIKKGMLEI